MILSDMDGHFMGVSLELASHKKGRRIRASQICRPKLLASDTIPNRLTLIIARILSVVQNYFSFIVSS